MENEEIWSKPPVSEITETLETELEKRPDEVSVNINIETHNTTAQLAQETNKQISDQLLFELVKLGFDRNELKFVNYNAYPEYDYSYYGGTSKIKGYVVYKYLQFHIEIYQMEDLKEIFDC